MLAWTGEEAAGGELAWARRGMPCSMETFRGSLTSRGPRSDLTELGGIVLGGDLQRILTFGMAAQVVPAECASYHSHIPDSTNLGKKQRLSKFDHAGVFKRSWDFSPFHGVAGLPQTFF